MRNFLLGVVVTVSVAALAAGAVVLLGLMPTGADATPPHWENRIAHTALDNSMEKNAPRANNPVPPTDANLIDGLKIYTMNCALCHGGLDRQPSVLGKSFYPPAPSLILHPLDDPEWHVFFATRTGIRYTGMPAWEKSLSEQDLWKVTSFLTRVEKLPPAVQDFWQKSTGVAPPAEGEAGHEHHDHSDHK